MFTSTSPTGGIFTSLKINQLNDLKGQTVHLTLKTQGKVHVTKLFVNDVDAINKEIMTIDKDLTQEIPVIVTLPKEINFAGGNNNDLSIVIQGTAVDGTPLSSIVTIELEKVNQLHFKHSKPADATTGGFEGLSLDDNNVFHIDMSYGGVKNPGTLGDTIDKIMKFIHKDPMDEIPGSDMTVEVKEADGT